MLVKCNSRIGGNRHHLPFTQTLEISFTNNPHAGFYLLNKDLFSNRKFIYFANTNAVYHPYRFFKRDTTIRDLKKKNMLHDEEYFVIRTRTRVDFHGRLIGAHYGILSGGLRYYDEFLLDGSFFNLNENDPNLEDLTTAERAQNQNRAEIEEYFPTERKK